MSKQGFVYWESMKRFCLRQYNGTVSFKSNRLS